MKRLWADLKYFLKNKIYLSVVSLVALFSYGFAMTNPSIGIDDTCIDLYFEEGIAPAVGRWVLYLLNKFIALDSFLPWMTEVAAVILLVLSVTLWCVLFRRILQKDLSIWAYAIFAGVFISCPLISEVFVFYLHNGICLAYGIVALALMAVVDVLDALETTEKKWKAYVKMLLPAGLLTVALGCYESFIIVYIIGMLMVFFLARAVGGNNNDETKAGRAHVGNWLLAAVITLACSVVFRALVVRVLQLIFGFAIPEDFTVTARNVLDNLGQNSTEFVMVLKRFWVMYYLNAFCYLPIMVLVLGLFALVIFGIVRSIQKKDVFLALAMIAIPLAPIGMLVVEGLPTHYRASQYVPMIGAFAILLLAMEISKLKKDTLRKAVSRVGIFLAAVLLWNQAVDMNRWFYIDYMKYENNKAVMNQIAYDLTKNHDISKPIIFKGAYLVPYEIAKDAYLPFYSPKYRLMKSIADKVDVHLLEKYNAEDGRGYVFAETPLDSTLRWGITAFDGTPREMQAFWNMHGYSFVIETDLEVIDSAYEVLDEIPGYPKAGYIHETEENIIINLSNH